MEQMSLTDHVHPYMNDCDTNKFKFVPGITKTEHPSWTVAIEREQGSKIDNTIKVFALDEVYGMHAPLEVTDIMTFYESYPKGYLRDILKNLTLDSKTSISKKEAYRILFGTEFEEEKFLDRPLSKLKHDLLSHIGIIDESYGKD